MVGIGNVLVPPTHTSAPSLNLIDSNRCQSITLTSSGYMAMYQCHRWILIKMVLNQQSLYIFHACDAKIRFEKRRKGGGFWGLFTCWHPLYFASFILLTLTGTCSQCNLESWIRISFGQQTNVEQIFFIHVFDGIIWSRYSPKEKLQKTVYFCAVNLWQSSFNTLG